MLVKQRGWLRFLAIPFLAVVLATGLLLTTPVAADCPAGQTIITDNSGAQTCQTAADQSTSRTNAKSCSIDKIGWLLCPLMESGARAIDWTFNLLADRFLAVQPEIFNNTSPTKDVWEQARNVANVMFVIAFVILIYSQITGGVMSNYGIKRMLPRLIIGAVAVNISYYICQAVVDLSNILGYNIFDMFKQFAANLPQILGQDYGQGTNTQTSSTFSDIVVAILAGGAIAIAFVGFGSAIISVTLITLLSVLTILMLRKAFIVLLIVMSPLAFVAYLLPNTEKYFQKWWKAFMELLMVFPIVALLLGAGTLASGIVLRAGVAQQQNASACQAGQKVDPNTGNVCQEGTFTTVSGQAPWSLGLIAVGIQIAPLLFIWVFLKGAIAAMGAVGGAIRGATEKGAGGTVGLGKDIKKRYDELDFAKAQAQQKHHMDTQVRAGTFRSKWYRPIRSAKSAVNKRVVANGSDIGLGRLASYKNLTAQALNQKEAKEASDMFEGDADFMKVWAKTGGDSKQIDDALKKLGMNKEMEWDGARAEKFKAMTQAGHGHSPASFMAAAAYLGESGKGSSADIANAVHAAQHSGASASEQLAMFERARSAVRKSGRVDTLADLEKWKGTGYTDTHTEASQDEVAKAISQVGVGGLNYESFKGRARSRVMPAFMQRINDPSNPTNIAGAVAGAMRAEGRTAEQIEQVVIDTARDTWGAKNADGSPVTSLQQANNFFENRKG